MINMDRWTSKRAIGVALILVSMLIVLAYSTIGNPPSANAVVPLQTPTDVPDTSDTSTPTNIQTPTTPTNMQPQANLKHSASGIADLVWNAKQQALTVTITMTGLAPNSTHPAHIHKGSCETSDQGILYPLNPVVANQTGGTGPSNPMVLPTQTAGGINSLNVTGPTQTAGGKSSSLPEPNRKVSASKTTITQVKTGIPASGWYINVHNGPTLSPDTQKTPIACADIINFNTSITTNQFLDVILGSTKNPNQAANGVATFSIANNQLAVTITMSGLLPGSTHQAHIHLGSCNAQGKVLYPLNPVVTDKNGNSTSTTTKLKAASIPAKGWYVNVHLGATPTDLNTQTGFDPLVCGDVVPQEA